MQSDSRGGARVRVLAVHTTEGIMRALDLRNWTGWAGSSHASADETGALLTPVDGFVPYDRAAWTLRSGNPWSENIELCALASWTTPQWLSRPKLLDACARWLADRSRARDIPLVKLSPQQYRAGASGVIGHNDHSVGYSDGTHWDPGPAFPWDVVLAKANAYRNGTQEDDMPTLDEIWQRPIKTAEGVISAETLLQRTYERAHPATLAKAVVDGLLDAPIDRSDQQRGPTTLRAVTAWSDAHVDALASGIAAAVSAAQAGSIAGPVDVVDMAAKVQQAVRDAVTSLDVKITA